MRSREGSIRSNMDKIMRMRVLDMHAHLACLTEEYGKSLSDEERISLCERELAIRRADKITTFFSFGTPGEWEFLKRYLDEKSGDEDGMFRSFGIHPWYSDRYRPDDCSEYFQECDAVGEIGMDSVWCDIPLSVQEQIFERQLVIASDLQKPIVLHTKGQEARIAGMIRDYPGKVCVHWYSGDLLTFERFLEMDCYFTLGPDLKDACQKNQAVKGQVTDRAGEELYRYMLQKIPANRLFIETDGISAAAWAKGTEKLKLTEISPILEANLTYAAEQKKLAVGQMRERMRLNCYSYVGLSQEI